MGMRERWAARTSLRVRILVATAVAAAVALLLALATYAFTLDRILYGTATQAASVQAHQVADRLAHVREPIGGALDDVPSQGSLLQVLDARGEVVAASDPDAAAGPLTPLRPAVGRTEQEQASGVPADERDPFAVVALGLDPAVTGGGATLVVATPLQTESMLVRGATVALGAVALVMLAGLLWLIDRVLTSALGRVEQVRSSVARIQATGADARVPVPPGGDEIARLASTMNDMLGRLCQADATQRAFVSDASHELRSPLTTIRVITESSPEGLDAVDTQVVAEETRRMQHLVEDLLTLAKADDEGLALHLAEVDVDDLVLAEARRLRTQGVVTVATAVEAGRVVADQRRLDQVLHNLTDNAARHARTTVRLTCGAADDGAVTVHVDNDGAPVQEQDREAVFDRFVRLQAARDRDSGGSGLGLAIVRALVEAHGGRVQATEAPDRWCRFTVTLPGPAAGDDQPVVVGTSR